MSNTGGGRRVSQAGGHPVRRSLAGGGFNRVKVIISRFQVLRWGSSCALSRPSDVAWQAVLGRGAGLPTNGKVAFMMHMLLRVVRGCL